MEILAWIRFIAGAIFMIIGLLMFVIQVFGVFRFKYVLNRMHAAAMCDTLALMICLLGVSVLYGISFITLKLILIIIFLWLASPVSSHLIARLEVTTNPEGKQKEYEVE